jgi:hypothetical protein
MTGRHVSKLAVAAMVGIVAAGSALPAHATKGGFKPRQARFKVTVSGVQKTHWTAQHASQYHCDPAYNGSGDEKVKFRSRRKVTIKAFHLGVGPVLFVRGKGEAILPTKGAVRRSGTLNTPPSPPDCAVGDGGSGQGAPASDCGRKAIGSLPLTLAYDPLNTKRITLYQSRIVQKPRFNACPMQGLGWPTLLSRDDRHRTAGQTLPRRDLFDRRQGKMIVIGRGKVTSNSAGVKSTTRITWTLTLVRLRH